MEKISAMNKAIYFDESITHHEIHGHQTFASATTNNHDEICIAVQHQDLPLLPSRSSLRICGRLTV